MHFDVIVVGLGPVGAVLAGLLGKRGVKTLVLERDQKVFALPRAAHVDHTGLRTIQEVGCLNEILKGSVRNRGLDLLDAEKRLLVRIPADRNSISGLPTSVYFYQPDFDTTLREFAQTNLDLTIKLGANVTSIRQNDSCVTIEYTDSKNDSYSATADWLVGCDGSWSFTRESQGIRLQSLNFDEPWLVLDLLLKGDSEKLPKDYVIEVADPSRPYLSTPISPNRQRFEFMLLPDEKPEDIQKSKVIEYFLKDWIEPSNYSVERSAVYTFHGLIAEKWRDNRIFLAGDAAHQTPPFLGQGMCAGIRDVANLAWKLDRVIKGLSIEALLDTYESERKPHALKVVEAAIRIGKVVCDLDPTNAETRNKKLLTGDPDEQKKLAFALPKIEPGALITKSGGALFPQVMLDGRLTDEIFGNSFAILVRSIDSIDPDLLSLAEALNAKVLSIDKLQIPAFERVLSNYQYLVVRPDRYICGGFETTDEFLEEIGPALLSPEILKSVREILVPQSQ